ncbi:MAG: molybdate ABC transporter substrate-binding protein [Cyanophyceae cyanobacterium]
MLPPQRKALHHQLQLPNRRQVLSVGGQFLLGLTLANCGAIAPQPTNQKLPITLTISAAASLQTLLQTLQFPFQEQFPTIKPLFNFASSGALQRQIEQGAQVDVFLAASPQHMDQLEQQGLVAARRSLLRNRMALVTATHISSVENFADLLGDAVKTVAIGQPDSAPVGQYAQEVLQALELYQPLKSKLIYGKDARQVLTYVTTGNAEAALVYASDVAQTQQMNLVKIVEEALHAPITYPGGAIADSPNRAGAIAFLDFLQSDMAQKQIAAQGFQVEGPKQR